MEFDLENPFPPSKEKIPSLFNIENDHMPSKTYIHSLVSASSSLLSIRREIFASILDFSRGFGPFSSYLAINYMDRFLSTHSIPEGKPWILKLVAISCISLALKMRKTEFSVSDLMDGGFMFDSATVERMEMLILGALKWRMRSVNPFSFVDYFISFFKFKDKPSIQALKERATEILLKSQNDIKLLEFKPSIISASALLSSAYELFPMQLQSLRDEICRSTFVNKENLLHCYDLMQDVAMEGYESVLAFESSSCTPANVLDLHCLSSSVSGSQSNPNMKK
ncbi:hypothetical protein ABFS83_13G023500 [Erythranthe nasuta]